MLRSQPAVQLAPAPMSQPTQQAEEEEECSVCLAAPRSFALAPCGHVCLCGAWCGGPPLSPLPPALVGTGAGADCTTRTLRGPVAQSSACCSLLQLPTHTGDPLLQPRRRRDSLSPPFNSTLPPCPLAPAPCPCSTDLVASAARRRREDMLCPICREPVRHAFLVFR